MLSNYFIKQLFLTTCSICLILFFINIITVQSAERDKSQPIRCFQCNSYFDEGCADWFNNMTYSVQLCPPNATMCRKIVQETYYDGSFHRRYIRQCAVHGEVGGQEGRWCTERIGTYRVKIKYCQCDNKDGCNSSVSVSSNCLFVLLLLALSWAAFLRTPRFGR